MRQTTNIYIARGLDSGLIKIGRTLNVKARMQTLCGAWEPLELLATLRGPVVMESEMHRLFAASLAGVRGREWFRDDGAIVDFIATLPAERRGSVVFRVERPRPHCRGVKRSMPTREERRAKYARFLAAFEAHHGHTAKAIRMPGCAACDRSAARYAKWCASHPPKVRRPQPSDALLYPEMTASRAA